MKNYLTLCIVLLASIFVHKSNAQTYTTMAGGVWTDNVSVWSTNGGISPCGCHPGATTGAVTIVVNHPLTVTPNLDFTGTNVTVNAAGSLSGSFDLTIGTGTLDVYGTITLSDYIQNAGANVTIHGGGTLVAPGGLDLVGGTLTIDAAQITAGGSSIANGATLNILNGSKFNMTTGNLRNEGTINMDPGTCIETNGNIVNRPTGIINGTGALNSGGNINNQGTIANTISWCANGAGVGMTTAEDCPTATGICSAIVLPIELTSFTAELNEWQHVEIQWTTLTEFNNSHFVVSKSADGIHWEEIGSVEGAGTTTEEQQYSLVDETSLQITYYLLEQYDLDGRKNTYDPVRVFQKTSASNWTVSPNPVNPFGQLQINNLPIGEGVITITDARGVQLDRMNFNTGNEKMTYSLSGVQSGIYLVTIEMNGISATERILVQD